MAYSGLKPAGTQINEKGETTIKIYNVNGHEEMTADVHKIIIYGHGEKLFEYDSGALSASEIKVNQYGHEQITENGFSGALESITLEKPIKRANKENLSRKDNYKLRYTESWCTWETRYALYIHESEISVENLGLLVGYESDEERNYLQAVKLTFKHPVTRFNYFCEFIPCGDDWQITDGGRWSEHGYGTKESPCYRLYDFSKKLHNPRDEKGVVKSWRELETLENAEIFAHERYYRKTEYSAERERKNAIAKALNDAKVFSNYTVSHYDIDKLEKVVNISLK